jgi:pimeloyl-ACP methyl ester carboxylesterase
VPAAVGVNCGFGAYPMAADELRARAARASLQVCLATPDRTEAIRQFRVPTLVVHGTADNLIGVRGGRATAAAIPGAELVVFAGMGHELPQPLWPDLADRIADLVRHAEAVTAG